MNSLLKGRDVRLGKLITILYRSLLLKKNNALKTYGTSYNKAFIEGTEEKFYAFTKEYLNPINITWGELKRMAKDALACFSGSDQIWNSSTLYVDPLYYLRFAPKHKRIALSPSFGRDFIADYNKDKMRDWISDYPYLSVREALHLLDPTLIINADEWRDILGTVVKCRKKFLTFLMN